MSTKSNDLRGISQQLDGTWKIRVAIKNPRTGKIDNRKVSLPSSANLLDALRARDELTVEIRDGRKQVKADPTLGEYAASWLERKMERLGSATTRGRYADEIRLHILGEFVVPAKDDTGPRRVSLGPIRMRALLQDDLESWLLGFKAADRHKYRDREQAVYRQRAPYSAKTINGAWRTFKQIVRSAVRELHLTVDPSMGVESMYEPGRAEDKANVLTPNEVETLLSYAQEHEPFWFAYMAMAFGLGLRGGELRPLRWDKDVDLDKATIKIQQSQRGEYLGPTKTKDPRAFALPVVLVEILRAHREWLRVNHPGYASGLVFPGYGHWRPWHKNRPLTIPKSYLSKSAFDGPLKDMLAKVGISSYLTGHGARRTFATTLDEHHVEASVSRSLGGWRTEEVRQNYTNVTDHRRASALNLVASTLLKGKKQ